MDNFMDEIVQKFTPQEMIRANAAADAAEIESLEKQLTLFKEQMEKYDDCLQEMRQVNLKNIETAQDVQQLADKMGQHLGKTAGEVEAASVSKIKEPQIFPWLVSRRQLMRVLRRLPKLRSMQTTPSRLRRW